MRIGGGDLIWFGPLKRFQKLFFHTPLVNGFILASDVYHDFYRWPLVDRRVFERWCETTAWGQMFLRYAQIGPAGRRRSTRACRVDATVPARPSPLAASVESPRLPDVEQFPSGLGCLARPQLPSNPRAIIVVMTTAAKPKAGLEDTVATSSAICYLDGDRGVLAYCGYDIHDLARHATFEEVCYLLWHRRLPTRAELGDLQSQLAAGAPAAGAGPAADARAAAGRRHGRAADADLGARPLRSRRRRQLAAGELPQGGAADRADQLAGRDDGPAATPAAVRSQPDPVLGHAANFLYMLTGERPSGLATRAFDVALILHADHELNASTFAARVAAATLTDIHSAIVGAIGTLKGPLHGGANADVMRLLLEIGADAPLEKAEEVVRAKLARKEKIPGFGHRVYHTEDPRATHLRQMSRDLGQRAGAAELVRDVAAHRGAGQGREEAEPERRLLFGVDLPRARHPDRSVHADLRGQPRSRAGRRTCSSSTRTTG